MFLMIYVRFGMYVCQSACPSKPLSIRPSICNMPEELLTYCFSTKNLRNDAFVCLLKGVFDAMFIQIS